MGRPATGVKGMTLDGPDDEVVGMVCMRNNTDQDVLVVSEQGMGKRSKLEDYRVTNRGGKGVKTINITEKTGKLIGIKNVNDDNDLVIINKSGIMIRMRVSELRVMGRATQGVKLINLEKKNDEIASVCKVRSQPEPADAEERVTADADEENIDLQENSAKNLENDNDNTTSTEN